MVAAIAIGVGIGLALKHFTGYTWTLWLGIFWGIAAAGLNVYKAYKELKKCMKVWKMIQGIHIEQNMVINHLMMMKINSEILNFKRFFIFKSLS